MAGSREHCSKPSGSIEREEFLDYLSDYYLLSKDCPPFGWLV